MTYAANVSTVLIPQQPPIELACPYVYSPAAQAGFPSPAAEFEAEALDLNQLLVRHPAATYFVRIQGDSLIDVQIVDGDIAVVDRSIPAAAGRIVVASFDGDIVAKEYGHADGAIALLSRNAAANYPPLRLDRCQECLLWGCVTGIVRRL
jgi:DNA polymerase V